MRFVACLLVLALAAPVAAQEASSWSFGPSLPFYAVEWDSAGDARSSFMDAGVGVAFMRNFFPTWDGSLRMLSVGVPLFVSAVDADNLRVAAGLTVGTFNNLVSVGVAFDVANIVDGPGDTGAFVGDFGKENVRLLLSFGFNIGGGTPTPAPSGASAALLSARASAPPPCYVRMPWQD